MCKKITLAAHSASRSVGRSRAHIPVRPLAAVPLALAAALAFALPAAFADGNADNGKQLFESHGCAGCHGSKGVSNKGQDPQPPILAGQYKDYIIQALHEYQKGERNSVVMKGMAAPLSDQDIKDLAEYLSALPGPLGTLPKGGN